MCAQGLRAQATDPPASPPGSSWLQISLVGSPPRRPQRLYNPEPEGGCCGHLVKADTSFPVGCQGSELVTGHAAAQQSSGGDHGGGEKVTGGWQPAPSAPAHVMALSRPPGRRHAGPVVSQG